MAQTKTSQRRGASSGSSRSGSTARASKGRSSQRSSRGGSATRRKSSARKQPNAQKAEAARSTNGEPRLESVKGTASSGAQTVSTGAQNVAQGVAGVVKKAKTPLIASGVAIAGLAGAAVLNNARSRRRKVLGVTMPRGNGLKNVDGLKKNVDGLKKNVDGLKKVDARKIPGAVTDAAKRADLFGQRVSSMARSVQMVSETADQKTKKG
jgi:hypothetical protein